MENCLLDLKRVGLRAGIVERRVTWENIPRMRRTLLWHKNPRQYTSCSKSKLSPIIYCNKDDIFLNTTRILKKNFEKYLAVLLGHSVAAGVGVKRWRGASPPLWNSTAAAAAVGGAAAAVAADAAVVAVAVAVGGNTFFLPRTPCILNRLRLYNVHPQKIECVDYLLCCKGTESGGLAIKCDLPMQPT